MPQSTPPLVVSQRPHNRVACRCTVCGADFLGDRASRKICSPACRRSFVTRPRARRVLVRPRARKIAQCHPERPHYAADLCEICYARMRRRLKPAPRCARVVRMATCEHTERKHFAKGLCKACYQRYYSKNNVRSTKAACHPDRIMHAKGLCESCYRGQQNRRRDALLAHSEHHTQAEWAALVAMYPNCPCCRRPWSDAGEPTRDHIVPVISGGDDQIANIQPLCLSCNSTKKAQTIRYIA